MMQEQESPSTIDTSILEAMRKQEQAYTCADYLHQDGGSRNRVTLPQNAINVACRSSMLQWMQTVVNFIGFDAETVEISMSYLDRFLQTPSGTEAIHCRTIYQLAAMTCLYTAVKINCAEALTPKLLAELSQGAYEADQFEEMEQIILDGIRWRVNPPTGTAFVREILNLFPKDVCPTEESRESVLDMSRAQVEWAVGDYDLLSCRRLVIAFAAVSNALRVHRIQFSVSALLQEAVPEMEMDLKQACLIQRTMLREGLPESAEEGGSHDIDTTDDKSVKSLGQDEQVPLKRLSAGRSPRTVVCRNGEA